MYKVSTDKEGKKVIAGRPGETDADRTERLKLMALLNGLFPYVDMVGAYRVTSTGGRTQYKVKWLRSLGAWGCTCRGYNEFAYRFPACPCIHVATVLLDIGEAPAARTIAEMAARKGAALYAFSGTYTAA